MSPIPQNYGIDPREPQNASAPTLRIDFDACVVELDESWDERLAKHGFMLFNSQAMIGQPLWDFLDSRRVQAWQQWFHGLRESNGPPPVSADPVLRRLHPWPADNGYWLSFDVATHGDSEGWLEQPLFQTCAGRLEACNNAARRLADTRHDPGDFRELEGWLNSRQPPLRLVPLPDLRFEGRPVFALRPPSPHDAGAFSLLARAVRSAMHDLSNPLAAMRMMAEVLSRADAKKANPIAAMQDLATYLDQAINVVHGLRTLIHADAAVQELEVESELNGVISLIRSEIGRRELEVTFAVEGNGVVVAGSNAFRLLVIAGLLGSCERARAGDALHLHFTDADQTQRLICRIGGAPSNLLSAPPAAARELILLRQLALECDGHLLISPWDKEGRDPDWEIEFGASE